MKTLFIIIVCLLSFNLTAQSVKLNRVDKWYSVGTDLKYVSYTGFFLSGVAHGMGSKYDERGSTFNADKWNRVHKYSFGVSTVAGGTTIYFHRKDKVGKHLLQVAYSAVIYGLGNAVGKQFNK